MLSLRPLELLKCSPSPSIGFFKMCWLSKYIECLILKICWLPAYWDFRVPAYWDFRKYAESLPKSILEMCWIHANWNFQNNYRLTGAIEVELLIADSRVLVLQCLIKQTWCGSLVSSVFPLYASRPETDPNVQYMFPRNFLLFWSFKKSILSVTCERMKTK